MRVLVLGITSLLIASAASFAACGDKTFDSSPDDAAIGAGDAASDGLVSADGAIAGDAEPDAADVCSVPHAICDDFDPGPLSAAWRSDPLACASSVIDSAEFVSSPNSLLADFSAIPNCKYVFASIEGPATHTHCEVDIRFDAVAEETAVFTLVVSSSTYDDFDVSFLVNKGTEKSLELQQTVIFLDGGGGPPIGSVGAPAIHGIDTEWHHVSIDLAVSGSSASVTYGAEPKLILPLAGPIPVGITSTLVRVGVERTSTPQGTETKVRYDNLFCDSTG